MEETSNILFIEDDHDLRETISELLINEGFKTILAENGSQGIQKAIQYIPDVIVCDIAMPGISGYEVFNMLRQINTTAVIPFIFLSAKSSKEDILLGLRLGVDDYIPKPFEFPELVKVVKNRIDNRKKIIELNDEKFHALLNNTFSGEFVLKEQEIIYSNENFAKIIGYSKKEIVGNNLINFVHKDDIKSIADNISRCVEGAIKEFNVNIKVIHKNNSLINLYLKGTSVLFKGSKRIVVSCDIVKEKKGDLNSSKRHYTHIKLTKRESEILNLVCKGLSNAQIASKLFLSERTIEGHRAHIYEKTGTNSAVSLAIWAFKNSLVNL